jgi:hypothetical protein
LTKSEPKAERIKSRPPVEGHNRFHLRVGDYRIIYTFDAERNIIHLLAAGNRREQEMKSGRKVVMSRIDLALAQVVKKTKRLKCE